MFKQNQKIEFNDSVVKGIGKICGVANNGLPIIGVGYIVSIESVECLNENDKITYDYTHIVMYECYIKEII